MEFTPKILQSASGLVKEVGNMAKKGEKAVSSGSACAERAVEEARVPAETWAAYAIKNAKGNVVQLLAEHTPVNRESLAKMMNLKTTGELKSIFAKIGGPKNAEEQLFNNLKLSNIKNKDFEAYISTKSFGGSYTEAIEQGIYTPEEFLSGLIKDMEAHSLIKSNPIFGPYNLSFSETSEISEMLSKTFIQPEEITSFLKTKNPQLFETLGGEREFSEIGAKNIAYEKLKDLQSSIHGAKAIKPVIEKSEHVKHLGVDINGEEKSFLYMANLGNGNLKVPKIGYVETKTMIESNMLTKDLIDNPEFISEVQSNPKIQKLLSSLKIKHETPTGSLVKTHVDFMELVNKVKKDGIESLSSNEVHCITDGLGTIFDYLHTAKSPLESKIIKASDAKGKVIYSAVQDMKDALIKSSKGRINPKNGLLNIGEYEFQDHFFMRMIDRNLASVTDNSTSKILNTDEVVAKVIKGAGSLQKQNAGNFTFKIEGIQGHGLKVLGDFKDGKIILGSVMQ